MRALRPAVFTALMLTGAVGTGLFSGCVFMAVRTVRYIDRKIDPPQPTLFGSATFFGEAVKATVLLRSTEGRRRGAAAALLEGAPEEPATADPAKKSAKPRMVLLTLLTNLSPATVEVTVEAVDSVLGPELSAPKAVALAPGQRVMLDALRSDHEANFDALAVTLILKRGEVTETRKLTLQPRAKDKEADDED